MKSLKIALAAIGISMLSAPVAAQYSDGEQFVTAVEKRDGNKAIELIENRPTLIDAKNSKGDTALVVAIQGKDREWTGFLLNKGADPNLPGASGDTPLIAAARAGFSEGAEWLLGLGAKVNGTNRSGETALIVAVQQRNTPLVKALLAAGADPDRTDSVAGYSARDYANRDARARDIQKLINDKKPASSAASR